MMDGVNDMIGTYWWMQQSGRLDYQFRATRMIATEARNGSDGRLTLVSSRRADRCRIKSNDNGDANTQSPYSGTEAASHG